MRNVSFGKSVEIKLFQLYTVGNKCPILYVECYCQEMTYIKDINWRNYFRLRGTLIYGKRSTQSISTRINFREGLHRFLFVFQQAAFLYVGCNHHITQLIGRNGLTTSDNINRTLDFCTCVERAHHHFVNRTEKNYWIRSTLLFKE